MTKPEEGAACDGLEGTSCMFGDAMCRCRHTEPIWTCSDTAAGGRGGNGNGNQGGAGGRTGGGPGPGTGGPGGGRGRG
jgi:hypothetical protein